MPRPSTRTSSAIFLRALAGAGERAGVDIKRLLDDLGVEQALLDDPDGWVPVEVMIRAWREVPLRSHDPDFGLHAAEQSPTGVYGVLEYATLSSLTVRQAFERLIRYYRMIGGMFDASFRMAGDEGRLLLRCIVDADEISERHFVEMYFAFVATRVRLLTQRNCSPRRVEFAHAAPERTGEHLRIFGVVPEFSRVHNALVFDRELLELKLRAANPALAAFLEAKGEAIYGSRRQDVPLEERVSGAVVEGLAQGDVTLDSVAKRLAVGARTLQRRLREADVSFAQLVDRERERAARRYVGERDVALAEVAFLLGFSQPSAFHRAFKRWTGTTPAQYRAQRLKEEQAEAARSEGNA